MASGGLPSVRSVSDTRRCTAAASASALARYRQDSSRYNAVVDHMSGMLACADRTQREPWMLWPYLHCRPSLQLLLALGQAEKLRGEPIVRNAGLQRAGSAWPRLPCWLPLRLLLDPVNHESSSDGPGVRDWLALSALSVAVLALLAASALAAWSCAVLQLQWGSSSWERWATMGPMTALCASWRALLDCSAFSPAFYAEDPVCTCTQRPSLGWPGSLWPSG